MDIETITRFDIPVTGETPYEFYYRSKWIIDNEMPILTQDKNYIEKIYIQIGKSE